MFDNVDLTPSFESLNIGMLPIENSYDNPILIVLIITIIICLMPFARIWLNKAGFDI